MGSEAAVTRARRRPRCRLCRFPMVTAREVRKPSQRRVGGRGLCTNCYSHEQHGGRLEDHPRRTRRSDDVLDDAMVYAYRGGMTKHDIARQLGYSRFDSLYQVFRRAGRRDLYGKFKNLTEGVTA